MKRELINKLLCVLFQLLVTTIAFFFVYRLWERNIDIPLTYQGQDDMVHGSFIIRAMRGDLNIWTDSRLGYPFGAKMYSFPHVPWSAVVWGYLFGRFTQNYAIVVNSYFFLTFALGTVLCSYTIRKFNVSYSVSVLGGICYSFCQFHVLHGLGHITASSYYAVPLMILLCSEILNNEIQINNRFIIKLIIVAVLICTSDLFFAFWGCMLLLFVAMVSVINCDRNAWTIAVMMIGIIAFITFILLLPSLIYLNNHSVTTAERTANEAYYWGLKIVALFIPWERNHLFSSIRERYYESGLPVGENIWNYIGIIGIIGLLYLFYNCVKNRNRKVSVLFELFIVVLLIGVSGGLGLIVALTITTKVRVYNRVFVYLYCFVVIGFCIFVERVILKNKMARKLRLWILIIIGVIHFFDMQLFSLGDNVTSGNKYLSDKEFVKKTELYLGNNAKVLCIPYFDCPENITETGIGNYNREYCITMMSDSLKSSFGVVYGTDEAINQELKYGSDDLYHIVVFAVNDGYDALWIDKNVTSDWKLMSDELNKLLGYEAILQNEDFILYDISEDVKIKYREKPLGMVIYGDGFYGEEKVDGVLWRWADRYAELSINTINTNKVKITFELIFYGDEDREVSITGYGVSRVYRPTGEPVIVEMELDLNAGDKLIFSSSIDSIQPETDSRLLNYGVKQVQLDYFDEE